MYACSFTLDIIDVTAFVTFVHLLMTVSTTVVGYTLKQLVKQDVT